MLRRVRQLLDEVVAHLSPAKSTVDKKIRGKIARGLKQVGLDGNKGFKRIPDAIAAAFRVLGKYDIEVGAPLMAADFRGDKGNQNLALAFSNPQDPFSPVEVKNAMLHVSWYKRDNGMFEVVGYLT